MNPWYIEETEFDPKKLHGSETVYTIGNGYFGTRGSFEEGYPKENPGTLLFGVFDTVAIAKEELANAPDWLTIKLFVNGERFRLDHGKILDYQRTLDMQHGILRRRIRWESPGGIRIRITSERFASLAVQQIPALGTEGLVEHIADQVVLEPIAIVALPQQLGSLRGDQCRQSDAEASLHGRPPFPG